MSVGSKCLGMLAAMSCAATLAAPPDAAMKAGSGWPAICAAPQRSPRRPRPYDHLPFSFLYDGQPSDALLATWTKTTEEKAIDKDRTQRTICWSDPKTGLEVRCVSVEYSDFPAVEWTVYLKNAGKASTPILENVQGLDTTIRRAGEGEFVLHGIKGDFCPAPGQL